MEWASPNADPKAWTAEIKTKNGILLSRQALVKHLEEMRVGVRLYGMEATIEGIIIERKGILCLAISRSKDVLPLTELTRKAQWDVAANKESQLTDEEKTAFAWLNRQKWDSKTPVRIVGCITQKDAKSPLVLEVRSFQTTWQIVPSNAKLNTPPSRKE